MKAMPTSREKYKTGFRWYIHIVRLARDERTIQASQATMSRLIKERRHDRPWGMLCKAYLEGGDMIDLGGCCVRHT